MPIEIQSALSVIQREIIPMRAGTLTLGPALSTVENAQARES
jgi:hypothetical protein